MTNKLWILITVLALMVGTAAAQDARSVLQAASTAMGAANLRSIQYSGTGWNAAFGQAYSPDEDWPRLEVSSYTRAIDYDSRSLKEEMTRRQGNYELRGGGAGGRPFPETRQTLLVSGNYAWALNQQGQPNPQPAAAELR